LWIFYIYLHLLYLKHKSLIVLSTDINNSENIWMQRWTVSSLRTSGIFKTFFSAGISSKILPYFKVEPEIEYNKYLSRAEIKMKLCGLVHNSGLDVTKNNDLQLHIFLLCGMHIITKTTLLLLSFNCASCIDITETGILLWS